MISPLSTYYVQTPNTYGRRNHVIDTISIHCMAGNLSAKNCVDWFSKSSTQAGSNYCIGADGVIACASDEDYSPWCTSNKANDMRAITIEVANIKGEPNWEVSEASIDALVELLVDICRRNKIHRLLWKGDKSLIGQVTQQNMTVHRWFKNKACPGNFLYNRHGEIADRVNKKLEDLELEDELMDVSTEKAQEILRAARQPLQDNDASTWSEKSRKWATESGLIKGSGTVKNPTTGQDEPNYMWQDMLTREQMAELLYRFGTMTGLISDK